MSAPHAAVSGRLPDPDLVAALVDAGFAANVARWVFSQMRTGPYTHYTVTLEQRDSQTVLSIDTFLLDQWVHSQTGETGESPHGSCQEYALDADGHVLDAAGQGAQSLSLSITYYGG